MASTLLAVDDSVTMRKVLEITFAGPDFRVVTANSPDAALQKLKSDKPDLVITDLSLEPNGYELCKAIKKASPGTPVIVLSSKQNAFDAAKGSAAQTDDHMDKPFDTQQMIDKVKKLLGATPGGAAKAPAVKETTPSMQSVGAAPQATRPAAAPAQPLPGRRCRRCRRRGQRPPQRAKTHIYNPPPAGGGAPAAAIPAATTAVSAPSRAPAGPTPVSGLPTQAKPVSHAADPPTVVAQAPGAAFAAAHVNGQMAAKLGDIGLSAAQIDAVLALSRDVVERVVWEVVPVLAETIIREEITRLTK